MPQYIKFCKIVMYTDDTRLYIEGDVINAYVKMSEDL